MSRLYGVIDGDRTRDNRNHNPQGKSWLRALGVATGLIPGAQKRGVARVGAPGADSGTDPLAALARWGCP